MQHHRPCWDSFPGLRLGACWESLQCYTLAGGEEAEFTSIDLRTLLAVYSNWTTKIVDPAVTHHKLQCHYKLSFNVLLNNLLVVSAVE